jgi:polyisoprenoid-binding protein YceI
MKAILTLIFALTSLVALAQNKPLTTTYTVAPEKTQVEWTGKKVTGQHQGKIQVKKGNLVFTGDELTGGEIIVDMNSMTVTDLTDKETADKFIGHMKAPDFFDTSKYPEAKLVIKKTSKTKNGLQVTGDLTMVGKTHPVTFTAEEWKKTPEKVSAKANITLDRTKWGLKYGSGQFFKGLGDKMIYDDFTLAIDLLAIK